MQRNDHVFYHRVWRNASVPAWSEFQYGPGLLKIPRMQTRRKTMVIPSTRLHPLVAAAAASVIIASMTASAVMTGILPPNTLSSLGRSASGQDRRQPVDKLIASIEQPATSGGAANGTAASGSAAVSNSNTTAPGHEPSAPAVRLRASPGIIVEPNVAASPIAAPLPLPAVFIHVYDKSVRQKMQALEPLLRQHGMRLAGIKIIGTGPTQSDLRYFHAQEKNEAMKVQAALLSAGLPVNRLRWVTGYETRATPRQYEVWLSPDFQVRH